MKLIETLTKTQIVDMLNGDRVGIFTSLFNQTDLFYNKTEMLCLGYYTERSGEKTISPTYEKLLSFVKENEDITETAEELLGKLIRGKFIDKWNRVYNALLQEQYNILDNSTYIETIIGDNVDTKTFDTNNETNSSTSNKQTYTRESNSNDDIYGFNSSASSPSNSSINSETETTQGDSEDNTSHNTNTKTGTETLNLTVNETKTNTGRNGSGADLIQKELKLRNEQLFFNILYKDIDSITTLQIYI